MRFQGVGGQQAVGVEPVNPPHELSPAKDLADEAFYGGEFNESFLIALKRAVDDLPRGQESEVEAGRQAGMVEQRLPLPHGVLVVAEGWEAMVEEVIQGYQCLIPGGWPVEATQVSRVVSEGACYVREHLLSQCIGGKASGSGQPARTLVAEVPTILGVEVPLSSDGFGPLHQDVLPLPHPAVKVLHAQTVFALGPRLEVRCGAKEVDIWPLDILDALRLGASLDAHPEAMLTGADKDEAAWLVLLEGEGKEVDEVVRARVGERRIEEGEMVW